MLGRFLRLEVQASRAETNAVSLIRRRGPGAPWRRSCFAAIAGDAADRKRYAELRDRAGTLAAQGALVTACHVAAALTYGWWLLLLVVVAHVVMAAGHRAIARGVALESVGLATFLLLNLNLGVAAAGTGGARSPLIALVLVPVAIQAVCFRAVVAASLAGLTAVTAVLASLIAAELPPVAPAPGWLLLVVLLAVLHCLAHTGIQVASSDRAARASATTDPLTGLCNRLALAHHVSELEAPVEEGPVVGVVVIDVDHFKSINDTHGHARGDAVLQALAQRLLSEVRAPDLLHRVGGEEFSLLLPGSGAAACAEVAERLCAAVRAEPLAGLRVTISAGAAASEPVAGGVSGALTRADGALYLAKRGGRDRVAVG